MKAGFNINEKRLLNTFLVFFTAFILSVLTGPSDSDHSGEIASQDLVEISIITHDAVILEPVPVPRVKCADLFAFESIRSLVRDDGQIIMTHNRLIANRLCRSSEVSADIAAERRLQLLLEHQPRSAVPHIS